jgi:hypothetical protein
MSTKFSSFMNHERNRISFWNCIHDVIAEIRMDSPHRATFLTRKAARVAAKGDIAWKKYQAHKIP